MTHSNSKLGIWAKVLDWLLDRVLDKIFHLITLLACSAAVALWSHHDAKNVVWVQAGPHLLDAHNEIYTNVDNIADMKARLEALEARAAK